METPSRRAVLLLAGAGLVLVPIGVMVGGALAAVVASYASIIVLAGGGFVAAAGLAGLRILYAHGRLASARARQAELTQLPNQLPIHVADVSALGQRLAGPSLDRHYQVLLAQAGVAPPPAVTIIDAPPPAPAPPQLAAGTPTIDLAGARAQGLSSAERWWVGSAPDGGTPTILLEHAGLVAIGGLSGTGKTNTAAWLAAQCAAAGGILYVADPHAGDAASLEAAIAPFSGAVERFAATPAEIERVIAQVWRIYDRRVKTPGSDARPVLLLIDEFLEQVIGQRISAESLATLAILASGGRKKQVYGAVCATNWGLGAKIQLLRQSITHGLLHRSPPEAARFLLSPAPDVSALAPGEAYVFGAGAPQLVRVPLLSAADRRLAQQASGRPARPYTPWGAPAIPPTTRVAQPIAAPPPPPPAPPTVQQRIISLLAQRSDWLTHSEIAAALGVDVGVVQTEAKALYDAHQVTRRACRRGGERVEYGANQPANQPPTAP